MRRQETPEGCRQELLEGYLSNAPLETGVLRRTNFKRAEREKEKE